MKYLNFLLGFSFLLFSCTNENQKLVQDYLESFNKKEFNKLDLILSGKFKYKITDSVYDKKEFIRNIKEDSILEYRNKILEVSNSLDTIIVIEEISDIFSREMKEIPLIKINKKYIIKDNKIISIIADTLEGYKDIQEL